MPALIEDRTLSNIGSPSEEFTVKDGVTIFAGAMTAIENATGLAVPYSDPDLHTIVGISLNRVTGDTSAQIPPKVRVQRGEFVHKTVPVPGLTSLTQLYAPVYAINDNEYALTPGTTGTLIGCVWNYEGVDNEGDVLVFNATTKAQLQRGDLNPASTALIPLGRIEGAIAAAGALSNGFALGARGRVRRLILRGDVAVAGGGANVPIGLSIAGTPIAGLEVVAVENDARPAVKSDTPDDDGTEIFGASDLVSVEALATGFVASTGGAFDLLAEVEFTG